MPQPRLFPQISGSTNRNHAPKMFGKCKCNCTRNPTATGKTTDVGAIGIDIVFLPHVVQNVEDDSHSLPSFAIVSGIMRADENNPLFFTYFFPAIPAGCLFAGRNENHERIA